MKDSVRSQIGHIVSGRVRTTFQSGLNSELAGNWEESNLTRYMGSKTIKSVDVNYSRF